MRVYSVPACSLELAIHRLCAGLAMATIVTDEGQAYYRCELHLAATEGWLCRREVSYRILEFGVVEERGGENRWLPLRAAGTQEVADA